MDISSLPDLLSSLFKGETLIEKNHANLEDIMDDDFFCFNQEFQLKRLKGSHYVRAFLQILYVTVINSLLLALISIPVDSSRLTVYFFELILFDSVLFYMFRLHAKVFSAILCEFKKVCKQYWPLAFSYFFLIITANAIEICFIFYFFVPDATIEKIVQIMYWYIVIPFALSLIPMITNAILRNTVKKRATKMGLTFPCVGENKLDLSKDFQIILKNQDVIPVDLRTHFVQIRMDQSLHVGIRYPKRGETFQYQVYFTKDITCVTIKDATLCYYPCTGWIKV